MMRDVIEALRSGDDRLILFQEAQRIWNNHYSLKPLGLRCAYQQARQATKPILELGSGLSTLIMGVASRVPLHALEDDEQWAERTRDALARFGIEGVTVHCCPLKDGWYQLPDGLPDEFGLVLVDGPQRNRERVFAQVGSQIGQAVVICDDVLSDPYSRGVHRWAAGANRALHHYCDFVVSDPVPGQTRDGL